MSFLRKLLASSRASTGTSADMSIFSTCWFLVPNNELYPVLVNFRDGFVCVQISLKRFHNRAYNKNILPGVMNIFL